MVSPHLPAVHLIHLYIAVKDFLSRVLSAADDEVVSSPTMTDKEKLIAPVKERGNINFKQERFKAAIGDYTTAIKLW